MNEIDFAVHYPFTNVAKELLKNRGIKINERLVELAIDRILSALNGVTRKTTAIHELEKLDEIASYAIARMIISYMKNTYIAKKYAVAESKRASFYLSAASEEEVEEVGKERGVVVKKKNGLLFASLPVYLKYSPKSIDYMLVNRDVNAGLVKISYHEWVRLIEEAIRQHIEKIPETREMPPEIKEAAKRLMAKLPKPEQVYTKPLSQNPPCIEALLEEMRQHKNLPHQARWFITVYLIKKGISDEEISKLFSLLPDYNEKITKYQIAHARKHGYSVPSCATVLSYGLCVAKCNIKNPLQFRGRKDEQ